MPNSKEVFKHIVSRITLDESIDEINSIVCILLEHELKLTRAQIMASYELSHYNEKYFDKLIGRINSGEPIQYITGKQDFYGRTFFVNRSVLIPRPETEILVAESIKYARKFNKSLKILDIGTGSGCIPIALSKDLQNVEVIGIDNSPDAIVLAEENNKLHQTSVNFSLCDILLDEIPYHNLDIVISNPPYITYSEKASIKSNVIDFEPHEALFVSNDTPLLFYEAIAKKSYHTLYVGGLLIVEINEKFGNEVADLFRNHSFDQIEIIKDLNGKDRIVKGLK